MKTRVKAGKKRSLSSKLWLDRQLNDPYVARERFWSLYREDDIDAPSVGPVPRAQMDPASARLHDICDYHSTVEQAAQTAARAGVRTLVMTHYVPAPAPGQEDEWRELAAGHFDGEVVMGPDLTTATAAADASIDTTPT